MARYLFYKSVIAISFAATLAACDSGSKETIEEIVEVVTNPEEPGGEVEPVEPVDPGEPTEPTEPTEPVDPVDPATPVLGEIPSPPPGIDLAVTPIFVQTTCDAAPAKEDTAPGGSASTASAFILETLVGGRLNSDSISNAKHYWSINLEPGIYHLLLENESADGSRASLGLEINEVDSNGDEISRYIGASTADRRMRSYETFTIEEARTVIFSIDPYYGQEDYVMGIFRNGFPVASPYFSNCPEIITLSPDTTTAFRLLADNADVSPEIWLAASVGVADYVFSLTANAVDPDDARYIDFEIVSYDRFGGETRGERLIAVFENPATMYEGTAEYQSPDPQDVVWFRVVDAAWDYDMTVTMSQL